MEQVLVDDVNVMIVIMNSYFTEAFSNQLTLRWCGVGLLFATLV